MAHSKFKNSVSRIVHPAYPYPTTMTVEPTEPTVSVNTQQLYIPQIIINQRGTFDYTQNTFDYTTKPLLCLLCVLIILIVYAAILVATDSYK